MTESSVKFQRLEIPFTIDLPIKSIPKGRPRTTTDRRGNTRTYTPKRTEAFEAHIQSLLIQARVQRNESDLLAVDITFHVVNIDGIRGDIDNHCKSLLDACNHIVWDDDRQIVELSARFTERNVVLPGITLSVGFADLKAVRDDI